MPTHTVIGAGLAILGVGMIGGLVALLYGSHPSEELLWLGIPGVLLFALAGLCALFFGMAIGRFFAKRKGG